VKGVDLWYVRTDDVGGAVLLRACNEILATDERARGRALVFEKDRHEHLVTRALCRGVLARALDTRPGSLSFRRTPYGRPELDPPSGLRFNLTNTVTLVACAVARGREVGLDAEPATRADDILQVAHVVFTRAEREQLALLDGAARRVRALQLWTAKEAYIKARGLGFSLPPMKFELEVREGDMTLRFLEDLGDRPDRWEIATHEIEGHMVALCTERLDARRTEVVIRRASLPDLLGLAPRTDGLTRISTMQRSPQ
jgi:4'-phosphopantetheinyl transferase